MTIVTAEIVKKYRNFVGCRFVLLGTSRLLVSPQKVTSRARGTYVLTIQVIVISIFSAVLVVLVRGELDSAVVASLGVPVVANLLGCQTLSWVQFRSKSCLFSAARNEYVGRIWTYNLVQNKRPLLLGYTARTTMLWDTKNRKERAYWFSAWLCFRRHQLVPRLIRSRRKLWMEPPKCVRNFWTLEYSLVRQGTRRSRQHARNTRLHVKWANVPPWKNTNSIGKQTLCFRSCQPFDLA